MWIVLSPSLIAQKLPPPRRLPDPGNVLELPGREVPSQNATTLELRDVLLSVERHYPLLRAIEQERVIAEGGLLEAFGAFDTQVQSLSNNQPGSTNPDYRTDIGISRFTPNSGILYSAGYRYGWGKYPAYEGNLRTGDAGEYRVGLIIPLLKNRIIDIRRARFRQAQIDRDIAEPVIASERLTIQQAAARAYWVWVAAGYQFRLSEQLVELAEDRVSFLRGQLKLGRGTLIDVADNQQELARREALRTAADQLFTEASINLSLFFRNPVGQPILVPMQRLPEFPAPSEPKSQQLPQAYELAYGRRPELLELRLRQDRLRVEIQQAQNLNRTQVDFQLAAAQDLGGDGLSTAVTSIDRSKFEANLIVQRPVYFYNARGQLLARRAQLVQLNAQLQFQRDTIQAEVSRAWTALDRSYRIYQQATDRIGYAQDSADGVRELLRLARTTVLDVNLREQNLFEARQTAIDSLGAYYIALADYLAALGLTGLDFDPSNRPDDDAATQPKDEPTEAKDNKAAGKNPGK